MLNQHLESIGDSFVFPGVPPGWTLSFEHAPSFREWCITLKSEDKEFAESFGEEGSRSVYFPGYVKTVFDRLEAQAGIKLNWK